jgi:hypothetical protein
VAFDPAVKVLVALNIATFAMALWTFGFALIAPIVFDAESLTSSEVIIQGQAVLTVKFVKSLSASESRLNKAAEDPADVVILRTAYDAKADYIVPGEKHLLSLGEFRGIQILTI